MCAVLDSYFCAISELSNNSNEHVSRTHYTSSVGTLFLLLLQILDETELERYVDEVNEETADDGDAAAAMTDE